MKNIFSPLYSLVAAVACALTLGSCSRAEYAMLPQSSSYLGAHRAVAAAPAASPEAATPALVATPEAVASAASAPAPTAAPAKSKAPLATKAVENNGQAHEQALAAALPAAATGSQLAEPVKLTRVQKFAASKAMRTLSKTMGVTQFKEKLDVAKTEKISGNLRTGIVLLLIALIVSLFSKVNSIFGLIGTIIAIIGLVFIVLWLLDNI
ncbi:hypothetical protein GCM10023185_01530 [Hymenobacter saemangeumensis]|uniref:Uncharacterized protein n=1 Tax=Hymenobacter saemangeumensis TaxID=1084522 RepID=A0ABP8HXI3_9BACT